MIISNNRITHERIDITIFHTILILKDRNNYDLPELMNQMIFNRLLR